MPKNISKTDPVIDPAALWLEGPQGVAEADSTVSETSEPLQPDAEPLVPMEFYDPRADMPAEEPVPAEAAAVLSCPAGHQAASPAARFCAECGQAFADSTPQEWTCVNRHQCAPGDKFCSECGAGREVVPEIMAARPKPDALLTEAERAERQRQHASALREGAALPAPRFERVPGKRPIHLIHFREDGLSFAGVVWLRGQEIELEEGTPRYSQALSWINLTDTQQMERYGKIMFGRGPWPGLSSYTAGAGGFQRLRALSGDGEVTGPTVDQLAEADRREAMRRRAVPAPML